MNLDILSWKEAIEYIPRPNSYGIRIFNSFRMPWEKTLKEHPNWVDTNSYYFDDAWPSDWKEYSWVDISDPYWGGVLIKSWDELKKEWPKATRESIMELLESKGQPYERHTIFNSERCDRETGHAELIMRDYEKVMEEVDTVVIHCTYGRNRSPAIGIAMNEIYGWGIGGLKEKYFEYRRYVYEEMIKTAKDRFK